MDEEEEEHLRSVSFYLCLSHMPLNMQHGAHLSLSLSLSHMPLSMQHEASFYLFHNFFIYIHIFIYLCLSISLSLSVHHAEYLSLQFSVYPSLKGNSHGARGVAD